MVQMVREGAVTGHLPNSTDFMSAIVLWRSREWTHTCSREWTHLLS
jgi:hypothetical protein